MGVSSLFKNLKITSPKRPRISNSDPNQAKLSSELAYDEILDGSKSICETVKGSHEYKIEGYSLAKGMGVGKSMDSGRFTVGGYEWYISIYPGGKSQDYKEYISLYFMPAGRGEVQASYELNLLDQSGQGIDGVNKYYKFRGSKTTFRKDCGWGLGKYYKRSELETSSYLKDDCLIIRCTVEVLQTRAEDMKHYVIPVPPSDVFQNLKGLLESETGFDITFQVGSESFKAHKLILAARSPVFRAQFFGQVGNPGMETVVIEELEPFVFKAMLQFLYSKNFLKHVMSFLI